MRDKKIQEFQRLKQADKGDLITAELQDITREYILIIQSTSRAKRSPKKKSSSSESSESNSRSDNSYNVGALIKLAPDPNYGRRGKPYIKIKYLVNAPLINNN